MVFWGLGLLVWVGLGSGQWLLSATGVGAAVGDECSGGFCFSVVTKTLSYSCCIVWIVFFILGLLSDRFILVLFSIVSASKHVKSPQIGLFVVLASESSILMAFNVGKILIFKDTVHDWKISVYHRWTTSCVAH